MQHRQLGTSDLQVPTVIFGAWAIGGWYWGETDDDAAVRAIHRSLDVGITAIDTAPVYGGGHSETVVGRALKDRRDRALILTKCGMRWDSEEGEYAFTSDFAGKGRVRVYKNLRPASIVAECEDSLRRLGTDYIDLYQCHWPDSTTDLDDTMEALIRLRDQGKIRAIGVSNFTPDMIETCLEKGPIASDQPRYSPMDRRIERDLVPFCIEHDVGLIVYSPIEQGLLTGKVTEDRTFDEKDERSTATWFQPQNVRKVNAMLERVKPIAEKLDATLAQTAIAWVTSAPGVTSAIVGARTDEQVDENAKAGDIVLDEATRAELTEIYESLGEPEDVGGESRVFLKDSSAA